jgi:hypothetical protein
VVQRGLWLFIFDLCPLPADEALVASGGRTSLKAVEEEKRVHLNIEKGLNNGGPVDSVATEMNKSQLDKLYKTIEDA